ncbi:Mitochondrial metalloendopeptidase OMA1 [Spatholobus suberectus]|nr:Mitochondrial metalloendopeptidase OMA1 [Spatholobus suberectus]
MIWGMHQSMLCWLEMEGRPLGALAGSEEKVEGRWHKEDKILDDKWVQQSWKNGLERGSPTATSHLDGLNWEILVVNEPLVNAFCLPGGKIVVFTGLFEHFKSDAEIATIIGHEVGHAVARHSAEGDHKEPVFRMEKEADYVGVLIIASAGYDPGVAPKVYEKLGKIAGDSTLRNYLSSHPPGRKRAELLAQAKIMEEALTMYRNVRAGRAVKAFL